MKRLDVLEFIGLKKFSVTELMWSLHGGIALCIAVFFLGSSIQSCASKPNIPIPEECIPKDMIITKDSYGHNSCNPGTKILKPIKVNIDGEEKVITQCVCPDALNNKANDKGDVTPALDSHDITPELKLYVEEEK